MVNGIGGGGSRAAFDALVKTMQDRAQEMGKEAPSQGQVGGPTASEGPSFADALKDGIGTVEAQVQKANTAHLDVIEGRLDLHEVAAQLKESEITFQFALQVRNKLMDSYREVMRMSV